MHESEKWKWSRSVVSDSSRPHGLQPTRLLHPWDFPGKSTGVGRHHLLQLHPYGMTNTVYLWTPAIQCSPTTWDLWVNLRRNKEWQLHENCTCTYIQLCNSSPSRAMGIEPFLHSKGCWWDSELCPILWASQVAVVVKNWPTNTGDWRRGFDPWVRKLPWHRKWQPIPVFFPGESHGLRSLTGYSP